MKRISAIIALAGIAVAASAQPTIRLRYAQFDPALATPHVPAALAAPASSRVWIVQFHSTPRPSDRAALESRGIAILRYIPDHAYVVRVPAGVSPTRPTGWRAINVSARAGSSAMRGSVMGERMKPGHTALTRIPR